MEVARGRIRNSTELIFGFVWIVIFVGNACITGVNYHRNARLKILVFCEFARSYVASLDSMVTCWFVVTTDQPLICSVMDTRSSVIVVKAHNVVRKSIICDGWLYTLSSSTVNFRLTNTFGWLPRQYERTREDQFSRKNNSREYF